MDFIFFNPLFEPETIGYYDRQAGLQSGAGLGSLFAKAIPFLKNALKSVFPALKKVASNQTVRKVGREVRDRAVEAGLDIAASAVRGEDVGKAASKNLKMARAELADDLADIVEKRRSGRMSAKRPAGDEKDSPPPKKKKKKKKRGGRKGSSSKGEGAGELFARKGRR